MWTRTAIHLTLVCLAVTGPAMATTHQVEVGGIQTAFSPMNITIQPGDTVMWSNKGGFHNVAADNGSFGNALSSAAWTFSHTFVGAGSFGYHCEQHGNPGVGMFGTVVVQAGGPAPAAPSNLAAAAASTSVIDLTWNDNSNNEAGFLVERRTVDGTFQEVGSTVPNVTAFHDTGLDPSTFYLYRVRAGGGTNSAYSNTASATTFGNIVACVPGAETLCVNGGRFRVEVDFRTNDGTGGHGQAVPVPSAPDSGLFYFFGPANIEMLFKELNACIPSLGNRFWTFFAATTNVEFAVVVTDTHSGTTKAYYNPLNNPAPPVQDTDAFATCP